MESCSPSWRMWRAHAKINLALAVGPPKGPRGYHPIASWFTCIGLFDEVRLAPTGASGTRWEVRWAEDSPRPSAIDWPIEKDLAVRAHRLLEKEAGRELPVLGEVVKRTPVGAGLGGGSADCAAALIGINELFGLGFSRVRLRELSVALGSDVAFFIDDAGGSETPARPALVTGFGEKIERLTRVEGWVVLILPPFGCPTGAVYQAFDRAVPKKFAGADVEKIAKRSWGHVRQAPLFNDLMRPAFEVQPRLDELFRQLRMNTEMPVHMSGSGSTLFMVGHDEAHAMAIAQKVPSIAPEVTALAVPLL